MEKCENCGRVIGKLETPNLHQGAVVCGECDRRLKSAAGGSPVAASEGPTAASEKKGAFQRWCYAEQNIICPNPNCGRKGEMKRMRGGSLFVEAVFFLFGLGMLGLAAPLGPAWLVVGLPAAGLAALG